jgi:OmpA-OmpF porin, OOP family
MKPSAGIAVIAFALAMTSISGPGLASPPPATLQHVDPNAPCFRWPAVDMDGDGVFDRIDHCPDTRKGCIVDAWGCGTDGDGDGVCDGLDQCPGTPAGMKVDANGCSDSQKSAPAAAPPVAKQEERVSPPAPRPASPASEVERQLLETGRIRLENVYFETASARLLPESEETLREVGRTLEKFGRLEVEVEGHTDTRGAAPYNLRLSQARAEAVRSFLLDNFHLAPEQYRAKGYGETRTETAERNDEELLRNRRVVLRVLNPEVLPRGVDVERKP